MAMDRNRLEFERIRNLVHGFGWEVSMEEITEDKLVIKLSKPRVEKLVGTEGVPSS